jgi:hypothetical protein
MTQAWDDVLEGALEARGWAVLERARKYSGSPNPTFLSLRRGRVGARLLVYGWRITGEGKGRKKTDYRIQTTVAGRNPIEIVPGTTGVGLGWDDQRSVFAVFDLWTKRYANWSDSVHITRALLDAAAAEGWAEEMRPDGPEAAFRPDTIDGLFGWLGSQASRRTLPVVPESTSVTGDGLTVVVAKPKQSRATAARPGDYLVLVDDAGGLTDHYVWRVSGDPEPGWETGAGGRQKLKRLTLEAVRHGVVNDDSWLEAL